MALLILILIIVLMIYLASKGKAHREQREAEARRLSRKRGLTDEELITIVLPTIRNDGK